MKKLLTLFTLLLCVCSGAWADNYYVISGLCNVPLKAGMSNASYQIIKTNGTAVESTTDISQNLTSTAGLYYNSTSPTYANLTSLSNYGTSSSDARTMQAIKINNATMTINLGTKKFSKVDVIYRFNSNNDLKLNVNGTEFGNNKSKDIFKRDIEGTFTGTLTITNSASKDCQVFVILTEATAPGAISFNPAAGSVETGSNITLSSSGANTILYQWGASAVDGEGNWSGAITYDDEHKPVVPSVGSNDNVLSVKATNTNGSTYGSATYTITAAKTVTTTEISGAGITNTDVKTSKNAGTLTASVTAGGSPVGGATVTWASSDESIVKVGETTGVVTLVAAGDANITATYAGDETYAASFDVYAIEVVDTRKQVTLSFSTVSLVDYNYDGETLTAPTLTAKDQNNNTIDLAELPELSFAESHASGDPTVTVDAETGVLTGLNTFGTSTITASFAGNANYKAAASKSYTVSRSPMLRQVKFDNGFEAFINEYAKTVSAYYMEGTSTPSQTGTIEKADGYTSEVIGNTIVLTKNDKTKTYNIVTNAVAPFTGDNSKQTFNGLETYIKNGYGYDNSKGWKFSKTDNDWIREAPGKTRIYVFIGPASGFTLGWKTGISKRNVDIYVNGTKVVDNAQTYNYNGVALNAEGNNLIEIQSHQTGGDGGFESLTLTGSKVPVTITAAGYATFSSTQKLNFTGVEGLTAYKATATSESSVTLEDVTGIVPAETGLLLKGAANTYYIPVSTADASDVTGNLLQSTATAEYEVTGDETGTAYVFGSLNEVVGFYKAADGKKIGVGKSWLLVPPSTGGAKDVEFLSFVFGDEEQGETDDIKAVSTKVEDGVRYNLAGQKVGADYKGIVIVNGKKVIIK